MYIERDALIAKLRRIAACDWNKKAAPVCWSDAYEAFAQDIEDKPAADVAPVVHGHWIPLGVRKIECGYDRRLKCSVCGWTEWYHKEKYCPNCGAKMDGGET